MIRDKIRQISVFFATIALILFNMLADGIPINGVSAYQVSEKYNIYFVPAGYAFSIWLIIYLGLISYSVFQVLPSQRENPVLRKIGYWYVGGICCNMIWMLFWHYEKFAITMFSMIGLLISLLMIYSKLNNETDNIPLARRFLVHVPFSLYLGWITMATIANVAQFLYTSGWNGFGVSSKIWAVAMILLTIIFAELTAFNRQDLTYLAVFVWSFIGIAVKHYGVSPVFEAACVAAGFVFIMAVITLISKPKLKKRSADTR